jgi:glycosyltransferase involved in cell wall biosynthesis
MPKASILIPTHNHNLTLPMTVASVQQQYEQDLEVIIVGDGVTTEVREVALQIVKNDSRITFLDFPKGDHHGETYRDFAINESKSENIFYLCDDDLFLPSHVGNLLKLLETKEFVQSRNGFIDLNRTIRFYPTDLSLSDHIKWHLKEPQRNSVSVTGTAHKRSTYLQLECGWEAPPPNEWTDHFLWKKFFRLPNLKASTHPDMTTIQLPTHTGREGQSQEVRATELQEWFDLISTHEGVMKFNQEVALAAFHQLNFWYMKANDH